MVATAMDKGATSVWHGEVRIALGRALLGTDSMGMTSAQLSMATGKDQSNLKKLADDLVDEGVLQRTEPPVSRRQPGRRAKVAFAFAEGEREKFEALVGSDADTGVLRAGHQLVLVQAGTKVEDLLEVLSRPEVMARAAWAGLVDGERQEYMIAFAGPDAVDASLDLLAVLSSAGLEATRASVGKIGTSTNLVKSALRSLQLVNRSRMRSQSGRSRSNEQQSERS
jgi:hypothetical protein